MSREPIEPQPIMSTTRTPITPILIDRVIYRAELCRELGVVSETMRRWILANKLPQPDVALSRRTMGWRLSTLHAAGIRIVDPVGPGLQHAAAQI